MYKCISVLIKFLIAVLKIFNGNLSTSTRGFRATTFFRVDWSYNFIRNSMNGNSFVGKNLISSNSALSFRLHVYLKFSKEHFMAIKETKINPYLLSMFCNN